MVQTILDTYIGGWSVFLLLGGEKYFTAILARTLIAHILLGVVGLIIMGVHLRVVHFVVSSLNRYYTWVTMDRPLWLPNEVVKEIYLLYFFFFSFYIFFTRSHLVGEASIPAFINFIMGAQLTEIIYPLLSSRSGIFGFFILFWQARAP